MKFEKNYTLGGREHGFFQKVTWCGRPGCLLKPKKQEMVLLAPDTKVW